MKTENIVSSVQHWVKTIVVGLNLCPFAKSVLIKKQIRFAVTDAQTEEKLLDALQTELELLNRDKTVETTLLILPKMLHDFYNYNQFLNDADRLLTQLKLRGIYQIASFHPEYQFGGTEVDDVGNYTNRAPYPILHLLREASLEKAIDNYPGTNKIPEQNIAQLNNLGLDKMQALLKACFDDVD